MTEWLLSITGIILLSVIVEFILPEGQINRYIRGIFGFITIFVIIAPLPKLFNKEMDFSNFLSSYDIELQEDYLYEINLSKLNALQSDIVAELEKKGIENVKITYSADVENMEIFEISVDLRDMSFLNSSMNKEKAKEEIESTIRSVAAFKNVLISFID